MEQVAQFPIEGRGYRFEETGLLCSELSDPVQYGNMTGVTLTVGSGSFEIKFKTEKGKKRQVSIQVQPGHEQAVQETLRQKIPGAAVQNRQQTAWEACRGWVTAGLTLAGIVVLIILINTLGQGATIRVPVILYPIIKLGTFLSVGTLAIIAVAILVIFGVKALLVMKKRKTVWELKGRK